MTLTTLVRQIQMIWNKQRISNRPKDMSRKFCLKLWERRVSHPSVRPDQTISIIPSFGNTFLVQKHIDLPQNNDKSNEKVIHQYIHISLFLEEISRQQKSKWQLDSNYKSWGSHIWVNDRVWKADNIYSILSRKQSLGTEADSLGFTLQTTFIQVSVCVIFCDRESDDTSLEF